MAVPDPGAVLITGVFGAGKTSVAEEMAEILEGRDLPYALLDLDYLRWFRGDEGDEAAGYPVMLSNLGAVVENYLAQGVRLFVLAGAIRERTQLDRLRRTLPMPLRVVRLTAAAAEIERRLQSSPTSGRRGHDLQQARTWLASSTGVGIEDLTVANDGPIEPVAGRILDWLGWAPDEASAG